MTEKKERRRKGLGVTEDSVVEHIDKHWEALWFLAGKPPPDKAEWRRQMQERRKNRQTEKEDS